MIDIKPSIATGWGKGSLYDILKELQLFSAGIKGEVYFVEANAGYDGNDGKSWNKAFKTLAKAITVSNANIAAGSSGWAARNTILIKGDAVAEDLTVPPVKCDVIGCGSCNEQNKTRIIGEHAWTGSGTLMSSGFYNLDFYNDDASAIFTVATPAGLYFGDCTFSADASSVSAILLTGATGHNVRIENCWIRNDAQNGKFATAAISITCTGFHHLLIKDCQIEGVIGINIDTTNMYNAIITGCTIKATTFPIDDESSDVVVTNNRMITAGDGTTLETVLDTNLALSVGNTLTSSNGCVEVPAFTTYA